MNSSKFTKPPLTDEEREKKLEAFISSSDFPEKNNAKKRPKKEKAKPVYIRVPESLWEDIHDVMARTGLSMNAICLEILRPGVKKRLKELNEE